MGSGARGQQAVGFSPSYTASQVARSCPDSVARWPTHRPSASAVASPAWAKEPALGVRRRTADEPARKLIGISTTNNCAISCEQQTAERRKQPPPRWPPVRVTSSAAQRATYASEMDRGSSAAAPATGTPATHTSGVSSGRKRSSVASHATGPANVRRVANSITASFASPWRGASGAEWRSARATLSSML